MPYESRIDVAGCRIDIDSTFPILNNHLDRAYAAFLDTPSDTFADLLFEVHLEAGLPTDPANLPVVFDCSPSWSMFRDDGTLWIRRQSPSHPDPFWVARLSLDFRETTVYCGDPFVIRSATGVQLVNPVSYPLDQILLMCGLARRDGVILHGAGLSAAGRGFVFLGRSGAGKTTLSRLLAENLRGTLLSDDRVIVRKRQDGYSMHGTPWPGEAGIATNGSAPLTALLFLVQAEENRIMPVTPTAALERLLPVASVPWYDAGMTSAALSTCEQLTQDVPAFDLRFTPDRRVADLVAEFGHLG